MSLGKSHALVFCEKKDGSNEAQEMLGVEKSAYKENDLQPEIAYFILCSVRKLQPFPKRLRISSLTRLGRHLHSLPDPSIDLVWAL